MRIILKPGGFLLILAALSTLVALFVFRSHVAGTAGNSGVSFVKPALASFEKKPSVALIENGDFSQGIAPLWNIPRGVPAIVRSGAPKGLGQYLSLKCIPLSGNAYAMNMGQPILKPLKEGDQVVFHGWLRSPESLVVHFYVEESALPHGKTVSEQLFLSPAWKEHAVVGRIKRDFGEGEAKLNIHFGIIPGTVEMTGFRLENYGPGVAPEKEPSQAAIAVKP